MVAFIIAPKQRSLEQYTNNALSYLAPKDNPVVVVRGEDVPFWVDALAKKGKESIGLTGEDLYREYCLKNYNHRLRVIKILQWEDPLALFKKPVLCLLGPSGTSLEELPKKQKVCITSKYKQLTKKHLNLLEKSRGFTFEKMYVNGRTESSYSVGIADLVVDIVYTGASMKKMGLQVYDKIFASNYVILRGEKR